MPKFKNPGAEEAYREKMEVAKAQRRSIAAEQVKKVAPRSAKDAIPKRTLVEKAVQDYHANKGNGDDPFLSEHSDKFINPKTLLQWWGDIRQTLTEEGVSIVWNQDGVFITTGKNLIAQAFAAEQTIIRRSAERYNIRAELTNKKREMQMPSIAVQLLLPRPSE